MPDPYWEQVRKEVEQKRALQSIAHTPKSRGPIGRRGERMYECLECHNKQYEHWIVRTRASRPRCPSCGSLKYNPYTKEAMKDIAELKDVKSSYGDNKGDGSGSFVVGTS